MSIAYYEFIKYIKIVSKPVGNVRNRRKVLQMAMSYANHLNLLV